MLIVITSGELAIRQLALSFRMGARHVRRVESERGENGHCRTRRICETDAEGTESREKI